MIIEGLVTTTQQDGQCHLAPMGPRLADTAFDAFVLRPFQSSQTFVNLMQRRQGVFHVTDDVEMLVRAAIHRWAAPPRTRACPSHGGFILADACRWYAFHVVAADVEQQPAELQCKVIGRGFLREFLGFQRARHAALEASILATRLGVLPREHIEQEMERLAVIVRKTAGPQEQRAFSLVEQFIAERTHVPEQAPRG